MWCKWRQASRMLCDCQIKGHFVRQQLGIVCGAECWMMKKSEEVEVHLAKMHKLRMMRGVIRNVKIRIKYVRMMIGNQRLASSNCPCEMY